MIVNCNRCSHPINMHSTAEGGQSQKPLGCTHPDVCLCRSTPNDIAVAHLTGDLTPAPERPARRPLGAWE